MANGNEQICEEENESGFDMTEEEYTEMLFDQANKELKCLRSSEK
jgi:hypothetical protein